MIELDIYLVVLEILLSAGLLILAGIAVKYESSMWRLLYLLPAGVCLLFICMGGWEWSLLPVCGAAAVMAAGFFRQEKKVRGYSSIAGCVLTLLGVGVCLANPGYRVPDFEKGFKQGFEGMKAHYCLTEWKEIDWDALYAKYLPKFQEVNAHHDRVENVILWQQFTEEFHDGHVNFQPYEEKEAKEAQKRAFGKDHGLSLARLSDGRIVAVNVEPGSEAARAGIANGCEVTAWDGASPDALEEQADCFLFHSPDLENEEFYRILYVAGMGGDTVTVDFKDVSGEAKQAVLPARGDYFDRLEKTLNILDQGMNIGTLTWRELSEDTVLFRVKAMSYDTVSYQNGDFTGLREEMEEKILQYKQEGKTKLVLDVRSNGGGNPYMILTMAELLGDEGEHFYCQYAVLDEETCDYVKDPATGKFVPEGTLTFRGRNLWDQGEIILLVNGQCVSAGDHFAQIMSGMDNVTVMGMTKSNASGQAIRYVNTESGILIFSAIPTLDENGDIFIDPGPDRVSKIPLDVKIPLDETAVRMLFDEGEDYVLWYAMTQF